MLQWDIYAWGGMGESPGGRQMGQAAPWPDGAWLQQTDF